MRVLILGAGASKVAGYPLASELIPAIRSMCERDGGGLRGAWGAWLEFKNKLSDPLRLVLDSSNPEVVFSALDLFDAAIESHGIADGATNEEAKKWFGERRQLQVGQRMRATLAALLYEYLKLRHSEDGRPEARQHRRYLDQLLQTYKKGDVVITFNWDVLVERCLAEAGRWTPADGYGIEVQLLRNNQPLPGVPTTSEIAVLKLHGSLGWHQRALFPPGLVFDGPGVFADLGFPVDNHPVHVLNADPNMTLSDYRDRYAEHYMQEPLFFYPSYFKRLVMPEFQSIWTEAARALQEADDIDVWGYSLPDADSAARALLNPLRFRLEQKSAAVRVHDPNYRVLLRWEHFLGEGVEGSEETLGEAPASGSHVS